MLKIIIQNFILGISLAVPLGPAVLVVIKNGINSGFKNAFKTSLGVMTADLIFLSVVFFGLSQFTVNNIFKISIQTFGALILIYLGYKSIKDSQQNNIHISIPFLRHLRLKKSSKYPDTLQNFSNESDANPGVNCKRYFVGNPKLALSEPNYSANNISLSTGNSTKNEKGSYLSGFLVNITNPIAIIWWSGIFGSVILANTNGLSRPILFLTGLFVIFGIFSWFTIISIFIATTAGKSKKAPLWSKYAGVFAGLFLIGWGIKFAVQVLIN